ncbi:MAG: thiol reductant ABC exporter subunit CydC [Pseudoxanthomonas sp.]
MNAVLAAHRRGIALTLALLTLTVLAGTALLGLAGHFLTAAALAGAGALGFNLFGPSAGIRGLTLVRILSRYAEKLAGHDTLLRIGRDLRLDFFRRALPLAPLKLSGHRLGDLLARLVSDIERVEGLLVRALGPLIALALLCVIACVLVLIAAPATGLALLAACALLGGLLPWLAAHGSRAQERLRAEARARLRSVSVEMVEGATDLAALDAQGQWRERFAQASAALAAAERRRKRRLALAGFAYGAVNAAAIVAVLALLLRAHALGQLSAAAAAGLFFVCMAVFEACAGAALAWRELQAGLAARQRLEEVLAPLPPVADPPTPAPVPAQGVLELQDLGYAWPGAPAPVLQGLALRLEPGRRIAIAGDSGAGKSSLLALLLRLADPAAGAIRFAGTDLRAFAQADWQRRIAWLPQDAPVFAGSMRENLAMGDPQADDARLWAALAQVRLEQVVRALRGGLDAWIGEGGRTLSDGQARRLALARALLRDAPLLLLDEPTEGLDVDTAQALLRDLATAAAGRSVILVSHDRLPDGVVDARYVLAEGRLRPG